MHGVLHKPSHRRHARPCALVRPRLSGAGITLIRYSFSAKELYIGHRKFSEHESLTGFGVRTRAGVLLLILAQVSPILLLAISVLVTLSHHAGTPCPLPSTSTATCLPSPNP